MKCTVSWLFYLFFNFLFLLIFTYNTVLFYYTLNNKFSLDYFKDL